MRKLARHAVGILVMRTAPIDRAAAAASLCQKLKRCPTNHSFSPPILSRTKCIGRASISSFACASALPLSRACCPPVRHVATSSRHLVDSAKVQLVAATRHHVQQATAELIIARQQLQARFLRRCENAESFLFRRFAPQLCNSLSISHAGQTSMLAGGSLFLNWWLCKPALCYPAAVVTPASLPASSRDSFLAKAVRTVADEVAMASRALYLLLLFLPVVISAPLCIHLGWCRGSWQLLLRWTLERAGPAFIKWGQWAATRPDMFPADMCNVLAALQTGAPRHSFRHTRRIVETALQQSLEEVFSEFSQQPVASGSIAQIHRATLSIKGAAMVNQVPGTVVAVKVRHPGVSLTMQRDFALMQRAALLSASTPGLARLNLQESVRQFGAPLREQLDLRSEARNLERFNTNFRKWKRLSFPRPMFPLVTSDVLVESYEEGDLISNYVNDPSNQHNVALADIGLTSYLQMLLHDNFIHADLHPGNILVRVDEKNSSMPTTWLTQTKQRLGLLPSEHVVLLDVGMVAELSREDQINLIGFFKAITAKDGFALAENILGFAEETCQDATSFVDHMGQMFDSLTWDQIAADTSGVIQEVMETVRVHNVSLRGVVSTVVVTTLVLEGWSSKLNPDLKMLEELKGLLPLSWPERIQAYVEAFGDTRRSVGEIPTLAAW